VERFSCTALNTKAFKGSQPALPTNIMQRSLSILLLGLIVFVCGSAIAPAAAPRPNIILIIADDLNWDDLGPYGNRAVRTPHLDKLARSGMRFENALVTASSCSPSRASLLTSRYPHNTDAEQLHWPLPANQVTFSEKLKRNGYWTGAAGKWHLGPAAKATFDKVLEVGTAGYQLPSGTNSKAQSGQMIASDESGCEQWLPLLQSRPKDRPFFLWLAALDPHRDYKKGAIDKPHSPAEVQVPPYLPDNPEVRQDLALYYDEITRLDSYVGQILAQLEQDGIRERTLVVFMSDNGRAFPRCKTTLYDSGIKTPFLVSWPSKVKPNSHCESLISSIDMGPTFLELAGVEAPSTFQGRSFVPLLNGSPKPIRNEIFAERNWHDYDSHGRAVRTERFKYIRNFDHHLTLSPPADAVRSPTFNSMLALLDQGRLSAEQMGCFVRPRPQEELYDLKNDPHELRNLALLPEHQARLGEFRRLLQQWQHATGDTNVVRANDEFDRRSGQPLPNRQRPRPTKDQLLQATRTQP
jgi:arylsulfatase A-like enzyme